MQQIKKRTKPLNGKIRVGFDKSISHRALIMSSIAEGKSKISNLLICDDTMSTMNCLQQLGIQFEINSDSVSVNGVGLKGLIEPKRVLNCGNSGTTMRLLTGVLAAQNFFSILTGDSSLNHRPMLRVIAPLQARGAHILGRENGKYPPISISGQILKRLDYDIQVPSAQVKSALLLSGLFADDITILKESAATRDHSEIMLESFGVKITCTDREIKLEPGVIIKGQELFVPADFSSASFFIVAASIIPDSEVLLEEVGLNPTRSGLISVLTRMGAKIQTKNLRSYNGELVGDILVNSSILQGINLQGSEIAAIIDELPILAVAMACAQGVSVLRGAGELRVKESDRIKAICSELAKLGASIEELEDGWVINNYESKLVGNIVDSHQDHRIAMSLAIAGLVCEGTTTIEASEVTAVSFPDFWSCLEALLN